MGLRELKADTKNTEALVHEYPLSENTKLKAAKVPSTATFRKNTTKRRDSRTAIPSTGKKKQILVFWGFVLVGYT